MSTKIKYGVKNLERDFGTMSFSRALEAQRLSEELTQRQFAKQLNISPQSLCDLEKGRKIPSPERAAKIARILKEPVVYWVQLALQDLFKNQHLNLVVEVSDHMDEAA